MRWSYTVFAFQPGITAAMAPRVISWFLLSFTTLVIQPNLLALSIALPHTPQSPTAYSENKKFLAEVTDNQTEMNSVLTVFKVNQGSRTFFWQRVLVTPANIDSGFESLNSFRSDFAKWISNDGTQVTFRRANYLDEEATFLRIVCQDGRDHSLVVDEILEPLDDFLHPRDKDAYVSAVRDAAYPMELFLDSQGSSSYALWVPPAQRWVLVDLANLKVSLASPSQQKELNLRALPKARAQVREHQTKKVAAIIAPIKSTMAKILPATFPKRPPLSTSIPRDAYLFLAAQKHHSDFPLIERLLTWPLETHTRIDELIVSSPERAFGDELLTSWNAPGAANTFLPNPSRNVPRSFLANISGTIRLPFAVKRADGFVRLYLIPAGIDASKWKTDSSVLEVNYDTRFGSEAGFGMLHQVSFFLNGLTPGRYCFKAILDRRPPYSGRRGQDSALSSPGDYESADTQPFELKAGDFKQMVHLACTNRVGSAIEYFAADDLWKAEQPAVYFEPAAFFRPQSDSLFTAPATQWIVRTNLDAGHLKLTWISWAAKHDPRGVTNRFLQVNARLLKPLSPGQSKIDLRINDSEPFLGAFLKDSHGCCFEGGDMALRHFVFEFSLPPTGETHFTLDFYHVPDGGSSIVKLASFDLRNLWSRPALSLTPGPFPVVSKSEAVDVSLLSLPLHELPNLNGPRVLDSGTEHSLDIFSFEENGEPAAGWKQISGRFFDRWGNSDTGFDSFCREEESFIYQADFDRDVATATFEPHEKINIPIDTVPHPGERKVVNSEHSVREGTIQIPSINGPGTFEYHGTGLIAQSTNTTPNSTGDPRFSVSHIELGPRGPSHARTIVASKIPFLICSTVGLPPGTKVEVLERDASVQESNQDSPVRFMFLEPPFEKIRYIPLKLTPGATNQQITLIVQKPITAHFPVKVPKRPHRNLEEELETNPK